MKVSSFFIFIFIFFIVLLESISQISSKVQASTDHVRYIVYMGAVSSDANVNLSETHHNVLKGLVGSTLARSKLQYSYHRSFSGFVADLTPEEASLISARDDVVSVFPSGNIEMLTTKSWDFLGLPMEAPRTTTESDVIIGVIDSGVWPESESFNDDGLGPPPAKWKGICQSSANFSCNNKIIGARMYYSFTFGPKPDQLSPRDDAGHGSHTASTAAGAVVTDANLFGFASGTARGAVPSARIAVYKVCWEVFGMCSTHDVLAAFDDAIADGVDIISISLGRSGELGPVPYQNNTIAIGSFHAMTKGILTSEAGGNSGPQLGTLSNFSPWSITVAASTIDRKFVTQVQLGNGNTYQGISLNTFDLGGAMYPIVRCKDLKNNAPDFARGNKTSSSITISSKSTEDVLKGKIGICPSNSSYDAESTLVNVGAAGYLDTGDCALDSATVMALPGACLSEADSTQIYAYINYNTSEPVATIMRSDQIFDPSAPNVASFSSRGPSKLNPNIMKPDISAPGVNILAAWPQLSPISNVKGDPRVSSFQIASGTSMACPHVSGIAAYVKEFNPTFSPAAIKSALMTTATPLRPQENTGGVFAFGSGQVNPAKAISPGLVYDATEMDYIRLLCQEGLSVTTLSLISGHNVSCQNDPTFEKWDFNYPAITIATNTSFFSSNVKRTLTNVGSTSSNYTVRVEWMSRYMSLVVEPDQLSFKHLGEELSFTVKVNGKLDESSSTMPVTASIVWRDGIHEVYSPVVVYRYI